MSKYTTGELAKLCGVSVRTVQYYDTRNILIPSELSEGGRRLYSEEDLRKMKSICFLRDAGFPLNSIGELFAEESPEHVISTFLEQQERVLREELKERQMKLSLLEQMKKEVKNIEHFSMESIGDIAHLMDNKKHMKRLHVILLLSGIPLAIFQWSAWILGFWKGMWWLWAVYALLAVPYGVWATNYYFKRVVYICPECHAIFKPTLREAIWANHTPTLRKVTCTCCGYHGFCVETYGQDKNLTKGEEKI